jgi:hypothetical protein
VLDVIEKHDLAFWIAVGGAVVVKLLTSPYAGIKRAVATVFAAVFSAYLFTQPAVAFLGLDPEAYTTTMAAVIALTGEGAMRFIINISNDPTKALEILKMWRGGK